MNTTYGFAAKINDVIDVRTVSPSRIAAKVNAIAVCTPLMPMQSWSIEKIDSMFKLISYTLDQRVEIVRVVIQVTEDLE